MSEPELFPTYRQAYKEMAARYQSVVDEYSDDDYYKEESALYGGSAVIVKAGDREEWIINECETEIADLQGFASVFEEFLRNNYTKYKQFAIEVPQLMQTINELQEGITGGILEMRTLLSDAVSEAAAGEGGGNSV